MPQVLMRFCLEFLQALRTAEVIGLPFNALVVRAVRFDFHATHRVAQTPWVSMGVMGMILVLKAGGVVHAIYVLFSSLETALLERD
ncbi:hypothetical protein A9179_10460 [Pseudomonas alcaligenes]|uniref:Uncharacterized protein n=1 Tax=Aquipseudomonas alcaligenes TaxID=43263 RepID=A0ABR7S2M3_AQUAC|nr:hypothetical protein [Pseudomonas alcaligenes]